MLFGLFVGFCLASGVLFVLCVGLVVWLRFWLTLPFWGAFVCVGYCLEL